MPGGVGTVDDAGVAVAVLVSVAAGVAREAGCGAAGATTTAPPAAAAVPTSASGAFAADFFVAGLVAAAARVAVATFAAVAAVVAGAGFLRVVAITARIGRGGGGLCANLRDGGPGLARRPVLSDVRLTGPAIGGRNDAGRPGSGAPRA